MEELQATGDFAVCALGRFTIDYSGSKRNHKSAAFYELFEPIGVALVGWVFASERKG